MAANLPSPVVGAGGQGRTPVVEQLLLMLASQGPGALMQWLEHRQASAQASAIDTADKAALGSFAGGANPLESGAIQAAGGSMGIAPTMQGMQRGVAGPLLERLSGLRTQQGQQAASQAQTTLATNQDSRAAALHPGLMAQQDAELDATKLATDQNRRLFPLRTQQLKSSIKQADSATRASDLQADASDYELRFQKRIEGHRLNMAASQALAAAGDARMSEAGARKAELGLRNDISDRVGAELARLADTTASIASGLPAGDEGGGIGEARKIASMLMYGVERAPTRADLTRYFTEVANAPEGSAPPDINAATKERLMGTLGLSIEEYDKGLAHLGGFVKQDGTYDMRRALEAGKTQGLSDMDLARLGGIALAENNQPFEILPGMDLRSAWTVFGDNLNKWSAQQLSGSPVLPGFVSALGIIPGSPETSLLPSAVEGILQQLDKGSAALGMDTRATSRERQKQRK